MQNKTQLLNLITSESLTITLFRNTIST